MAKKKKIKKSLAEWAEDYHARLLSASDPLPILPELKDITHRIEFEDLPE